MIVNRRLRRRIGLAAVSGMLMLSLSSFMPAKNEFTAAEQQQVSIATPGLFAQSQAFNVDFEIFRAKEYSFPLPVGKASLINGNSVMRISTAKGDAVKAMFDGYVRLSRKTESMGNVIVIRHDNGLETVYANNAENLVKVGQSIDAGQTIAIVGTREGETYCDFSIMVNGARINPETIIELKSHKLRRQTVQFRKEGNRIGIKVIGGKDSSVSKNDKNDRNNKETNKKSGSSRGDHAMTLDPDEVYDPFTITNTFLLDLEKIEEKAWAYPLSDARVISPYGGARRHSGVDLKTKPNDEIYAAFDGEVVASGPYYGYGNCIRIKHAYGLETLYSHQSKNMVKKGDKVKAGQVIGLTGRTGRATTEHLHFEVSFGGKRLDPAIIFDHSNHKLKAATLHLTKGKGVKSVKNR
jgi:murein DD-endopeptidase MepM/ murein hydrolase activator NlpD